MDEKMENLSLGETAPASFQDGDFLKELADLSEDRLLEEQYSGVSYERILFSWAEGRLGEEQLRVFQSMFSVKALREAFESGTQKRSFDFDDPKDQTHYQRLVLRMFTDGDTGNILCASQLSQLVREKRDQALPDQKNNDSIVHAILRSSLLFFSLDLNHPEVEDGHVFQSEKGLKNAVHLPCSYDSFLAEIASRYVNPSWQEEFLHFFSVESLQEAVRTGGASVSHSFSSPKGTLRMDAYLPQKEDEKGMCYFELANLDHSGNVLLLTGQDGDAMRMALEDMKLDMEMERSEVHKRHIRHLLLLFAVTIVAGALGGAVLDHKIPAFSSVLSQFLPEEAEEPPVEETTAATTEEAEVAETVTNYIPFTNTLEFSADILENGLSRMHASTSDSYGTLTFTMKVSETLSPDWFGARYKNNYYLDGSEACVSFSMKYTTDSEGYDSVIPQDAFSISVTDGEGKIIQGYQIMDKAIAGSYNVSLSRGKTSQLYKRYAYSEDCRYLRLTYYSDEVRHDVYFALTYDDPNAEYEEMTLGARNEFVRAMKQKLAALGFLDEKYKSSDYFDNNTLAAVKAAQEKYGMEQTGVADAAFLKQLYSDEGS